MPVLIEGPTWIARPSVLDARLAGGAAAFTSLVPPDRRTTDGELVAISLGSARESWQLARALERAGLLITRPDGAFADAAVLHHARYPDTWCPWLELAAVDAPGGGLVLAARLARSERTDLAVPPGWTFERSASAREGVHEPSPPNRPLRFTRREPGAAVYLDAFTGAEVRVPLPPPVRVQVVTAAGAAHAVTADVVRSGGAIELGLMHRERLDPDAGMLFEFGREEWRSFWMKNTLVPLDMLFIRADGTIANAFERATPLTLTSCPSREPCASVLEVNGGWVAAHGIRPGDRVGVPGRMHAPVAAASPS